ncbi:MAG TPA: class I SAM-dependent methyltransferase [Croceibacterium sp.]|nr:class I SAM-dependent methyltransferase [Propylenella sp.]HYD25595.1 class I SAM-dependent methyltransferase [Croceibacterium sp.]
MNYARTADDSIYLNEDRYLAPKESFKQIASLLNIEAATGSLVDIGCATGEFLHYARTLNAELDLKGVEYSPNLVAHGNEQLGPRRIEILQGDANKLPLEAETFDLVTTIGVTSIFDDFRPSFDEMIRIARPGGRCLNHMLVNEDAMDVIVRYVKDDGELEAGWNRFSIRSITQHLEQHTRVGAFRFIKHEMPFDIPQRDDPMRSWTRIIDGKRVLWNGLGTEVSLFHVLFDVV